MKLTQPELEIRRHDERMATRRLVSERVQCVMGENRWRGSLTDISASGAFVESEHVPPVGGQVQMDFTLLFQDRGLRVRFQLRATVVRTQISEHSYSVLYAQGFSVRFLELSAKERLCLKAFTQTDTTSLRPLVPSA